MSKKIIAVILVAVMLISGCSKSEDKPTENNNTVTQAVTPEEEKDPVNVDEDDPEPENPENDDITLIEDDPEGNTDPEGPEDISTGSEGKALSMSVNASDGQLSIKRASAKSGSMGQEGTWTIFVYLCGTDLESNGKGFATGDLYQMITAEASDNVKFIIQTGGTNGWANEVFDGNRAERWMAQNNDIVLVDSKELANMGSADTLKDFLSWGVANYPADKMGVIFWDHGCGSINGVCVDELNDRDTLDLVEMNEAFSEVYSQMTDKFEFIGFDCCLMGSSELANILATYSRYFYGSQETEPGTGWNYTAIGTFLAQNNNATGAELGKVITDSFYEECVQSQQENECTFTIVDLEKIDEFAIAFNDYCKRLYEAAGSDFSGIVRGVNSAENFGGNNKAEGYTNMVDIGGIVENCSAYADGTAVLNALKNCIVYNKNGSDHANASGLSIYYPLEVGGSNELAFFSKICFSPYYLSIVDRVAKGYSTTEYDNAGLFDNEGNWVNEDCAYEDISDSYFEYEDDGKESSLITFAEGPLTDPEEGYYGFVLDEKSREYAASVAALIYMNFGDETLVELGETYDINADWENGVFIDNFDGLWLALPDGNLLATYIADVNEGNIVYASPIYLNGERTNLRIRQGDDGTFLEGAWDGIDENGVPSREIKQIQAGDKVAPVYYVDDDEVALDEYEWQEDDNITYAYLPEANYFYAFAIEDVYGDICLADMTMITIDENGQIEFHDITK